MDCLSPYFFFTNRKIKNSLTVVILLNVCETWSTSSSIVTTKIVKINKSNETLTLALRLRGWHV
jgi:hypothetical protein